MVIQTKIKGPESISVVTTLKNIGFVYDHKGDYAKALELYHKSLEIRTKIKEPDSIDITIGLGNIGLVHLKKRDYANTLEHLKNVLN